MGPVPGKPSRSRQGWLEIGDDRRATVSGDTISLELRLTGTPDAPFVEAFLAPGSAQHHFESRQSGESPRIEGDLICWSIRTSELRIAWQHLIRCLERANFRSARHRLAASPAARVPAAVPLLAAGGRPPGREPGVHVLANPGLGAGQR